MWYVMQADQNANLIVGFEDKITKEETKVEKTGPVVRANEKNLKLLADSWRMAQEIDKAIPVLERAAKMSKDGKSYVLLGNLYLSEDRVELAVDAIKKRIGQGKNKENISSLLNAWPSIL